MMKLASRVILVTVALFALGVAGLAQGDGSQMTEKDPRNTAPTVGGGGPAGGATGLFTVFDGKTLRKGEHTLSIAYNNWDRDPGNADFTEVPISFNIALGSNRLELWYSTTLYRGVKINSPRNLSSFYLPDASPGLAGVSFPAIVLAPDGPGPNPFAGLGIFRPAGTAPVIAFPYSGGSVGNFGVQVGTAGPVFGFPIGPGFAGPVVSGGSNGSFFPGVGSVVGGILPGVVLATAQVAGAPAGFVQPISFTLEPSYLPDAPFINRRYGETMIPDFPTHNVGIKWRWTDPDAAVGVGLHLGYRWYMDRARNASQWEDLTKGASPGGSWGDFMGTLFFDARVGEHVNVSANVGYHLNSSVKANIDGFNATLLNRPDELLLSAAVDFPINRFFQPIVEVRHIRYMGSRTPNAFENDPTDVIAGFRLFPKRWFGFGFAYRRHMNQQDEGRMDETTFSGNIRVIQCFGLTTVPDGISQGCTDFLVTNASSTGVPPGFQLSENPHGWIAQFFIGRRNPRLAEVQNQFANVTALSLSDTTITLPCPPGFVPVAGTCDDTTTVSVTTTAVDPENDVLTYNYTVSGGRIIGTGANVQWDLSGLQPGTYTITAGVDDGCGLCGQTQTQTVTIAACECRRACECPSIVVSGPAGVTNPGDTMTFTASVSGGPDVTYNWTVSGGTIESGQGTPSIVVRTSMADAGTNITATVTVGGLDPACNCPATDDESGPVAGIPDAVLIDEFGRLANDDIRGRLDNFFAELSNNPNNQGYIINYGTDREIAARERLIINHINFRNFDRSRITLVRGGDTGEGPRTRLYRIPPGAANPNP